MIPNKVALYIEPPKLTLGDKYTIVGIDKDKEGRLLVDGIDPDGIERTPVKLCVFTVKRIEVED